MYEKLTIHVDVCINKIMIKYNAKNITNLQIRINFYHFKREINMCTNYVQVIRCILEYIYIEFNMNIEIT